LSEDSHGGDSTGAANGGAAVAVEPEPGLPSNMRSDSTVASGQSDLDAPRCRVRGERVRARLEPRWATGSDVGPAAHDSTRHPIGANFAIVVLAGLVPLELTTVAVNTADSGALRASACSAPAGSLIFRLRRQQIQGHTHRSHTVLERIVLVVVRAPAREEQRKS
jgi:hypothetical protein